MNALLRYRRNELINWFCTQIDRYVKSQLWASQRYHEKEIICHLHCSQMSWFGASVSFLFNQTTQISGIRNASTLDTGPAKKRGEGKNSHRKLAIKLPKWKSYWEGEERSMKGAIFIWKFGGEGERVVVSQNQRSKWEVNALHTDCQQQGTLLQKWK